MDFSYIFYKLYILDFTFMSIIHFNLIFSLWYVVKIDVHFSLPCKYCYSSTICLKDTHSLFNYIRIFVQNLPFMRESILESVLFH